MLAGIKEWIEDKGFESVNDFRGRVSQVGAPDPAEFERSQYVHILDSYSFWTWGDVLTPAHLSGHQQ